MTAKTRGSSAANPLGTLRALTAASAPGGLVGVPYDVAEAVLEQAEAYGVLDESTDETVAPDRNYGARAGFDEKFLGVSVGVPRLKGKLKLDLVEFDDDGTKPTTLDYNHFSLAMSKSRRFARWTAVNIDGKNRFSIERTADRWFFDPRINRRYQVGAELYNGNDFDKGHLVRRQDPDWGSDMKEALAANDDTFHFTNCTPQHKDFNRNPQTWHGLEDYILNNAADHQLRVCVFNGPVLADDDPTYRDIQIPELFWKVVVTITRRMLHATAYLLSQKGLVAAMEDEEVFNYGEYKTFQTTVVDIESKTGLDFGTLRDHDPLAPRQEERTAGPEPTPLESFADITL